MTFAAPELSSRPSRRAALIGGLGLTAFGSGAWARRAPVITMLGDSITAGLGLPAEAALPAQLQAALARLGVAATVRGAGVSGDTTAGGLARADFSVQSDTDLCIVALGGNDLLQGLPPRTMRANLEGILRRLKARHIRVLLCGLKAPSQLNAGYARAFNAVFLEVAQSEGAAFYPDLLAGVALTPGLNQRDGLHPNARGVKIIAARLAPIVIRGLKARA